MLDAEPSPRARGLGPLALRVLAAAAALALAACAPEPEPPVEEPLPGEDPSLIVTLSESSLSLHAARRRPWRSTSRARARPRTT